MKGDGNMNIMIVDDHIEIRTMLKEMLDGNDNNIIVAGNGKQAIELLAV
ncbi:MAG: response regulator, partial [Chitinivibrionales bacterium]|nr:response regulator [Chitinivibrionales bacterium]